MKMDTSQEYILMCQKAEEIQKLAKTFPYEDRVEIATSRDYGFPFYRNIWLPRQDQLQEMVGLSLWPLNCKFSLWLYDHDSDGLIDLHVRHEHEFYSMEQLWLAFCMFEKYGKVWSNGEWVNV